MAKSRGRKYKDLFKLASLSSESTILDVGVADKEYSPVDNYLEKFYPKLSQLTALSIHSLNNFKILYPEVRTVMYSGSTFPFLDNAFTVVHANAVIEHVGNKDKQLKFINEMARCGQQFFFSTPAKEFIFEIHTNFPFIHWFPKPLFDSLLIKMGRSWASKDYMHLLSKKSLRQLMQKAATKSYRIITYKFGFIPFQHIVYGKA